VVWQDNTVGAWGGGADVEIMHVVYSSSTGWSNTMVISDGYNGTYWNNAASNDPAITADGLGNVYVVWEDDTNGVGTWGTDVEIMHVVYSPSTGWSDAAVISDGHNGIYWNSGPSNDPAIAIGSGNIIYVVWEDTLAGAAWGGDTEIMYSSYSESTGWILPRVISDGFDGTYWNVGLSVNPDIIIDANGVVHVLWDDFTSGVWGSDYEIMHANYTISNGWSNVTIISDGYGGVYWNNGNSQYVATKYGNGKVHVVWSDTTDGIWGVDTEIMYSNIPIHIASQAPAIPFGNFYLIFMIVGIVAILFYVKKKINI
jgi:hypothetical protein